MTQEDLKRLELNLTKSAIKAKKYWVRGMVGYTESDQGFMPIESIPVSNPIKGLETPLAELIEDIGKLNEAHNILTFNHQTLVKEFNDYKASQALINRDLQAQINKLNSVDISELRIVVASLADRLKQLEDETDIL